MLYFDADTLVYRAGFAVQKKHYLLEQNHIDTPFIHFNGKKELNAHVKENPIYEYTIWEREELKSLDECIELVDSMVAAVINECAEKTETKQSIKMYLSGPGNFREVVAVTKKYKGNRDNAQKPVYYDDIRNHLIKVYGAMVVSGLEADDAVSVDYTAGKDEEDAILVSADKDLDQIAGKHYDWVKKEFYEISTKEAKTRFYIQLIAGDSVDNIPGIPGMGEKKAAKALQECKSPEDMATTAIALYKEAYKDTWKDVIKEQARLVYILRQEEDSTRRPLHFFGTKDGKLLKSLLGEDNCINTEAA